MECYEKKILGRILGYRQKEKRIPSSSIWLYKSSEVKEEYCNACKLKCSKKITAGSHKIYERIKQGGCVVKDCYYCNYASKVGYTFKLSALDNKHIDSFEEKLLELIKSKNEEGYRILRQRIVNFSEKFKNVIYYDEMCFIFKSVIDLELGNEIEVGKLTSLINYLYANVRSSTKKVFLYCLILLDGIEDYGPYIGRDYPENFELHLKRDVSILSTIDQTKLKGADLFFYYETRALTSCKEDNSYYLKKAKECVEVFHMARRYYYEIVYYEALDAYKIGSYKDAYLKFYEVFTHDRNLMKMDVLLFLDCYERFHTKEQLIEFMNNHIPYGSLNTKARKAVGFFRIKYNSSNCMLEIYRYLFRYVNPLSIEGTLHDQYIKSQLDYYYSRSHKTYVRLSDRPYRINKNKTKIKKYQNV